MRVFVVSVGFVCVLGCTRASSLPPKPAGVHEGAVLIPSIGAASQEPLWVTCASDNRCNGPYLCSLFSSKGGALVRQGCFSLTDSAASGAPTPTVIHLRGHQGAFLLAQSAWLLAPAPQRPVIADPPPPLPPSPRPRAV